MAPSCLVLPISNPGWDSQTFSYLYDATGTKLKKTAGTVSSYYQGSVLKLNGVDIVLTGEGRAVKNGTWSYEYDLRDHLGNTRVSFTTLNGKAQPLQYRDYYPFGLEMARSYPNDPTATKYRYNGKELQDEGGLGWYDYGARFYDPAVVRTPTLDPHAENHYSESPYSFLGNNPINSIDPDGQDWYQWKDDKGNQAVTWREGDAKSLDINGQSYSNIGTSYTQDIGNNASITYNQNEAVSMTETVLGESDFKSQMTGNVLPNGKFEKKPEKDGKKEGDCFYQSGEMVKVSGAISGVNDGKDSQRGESYINSEIDAGHSTRVNVDRNNDGNGDHWVAISSRTTDIKSQKSSYGYFDPAGRNLREGTRSSFSQGTNGKLQGRAKAYSSPTNYVIVGVRKNNR